MVVSDVQHGLVSSVGSVSCEAIASVHTLLLSRECVCVYVFLCLPLPSNQSFIG